MSVEEDITKIVHEYETKNGPNSTEKILSSIMRDQLIKPGVSIEEIASDPESFAYKIVEDRYPEILDRELLAGVLSKKYLDPESEFQNEFHQLEFRHSAAIEQGHPPVEYSRMAEKNSGIFNVVKFLTAMNWTEYETLQKKWEKEAEQEKEKEITFKQKREAVKEFESYRILVPREGSEESVELSLKEYINSLAVKMFREEMKKTDIDTRIEHIKANFKFAIKPIYRMYIFEEYLNVYKTAQKNWLTWEIRGIQQELEEHELLEYRRAHQIFKAAENSLYIVKNIIS